MSSLKALIVDDEENAILSLRVMLEEFCPDVEIGGTAHSALEAARMIAEYNADLVFLDIAMPGGTGFDLLRVFPKRSFEVIFTTAYEEHVIHALRQGARDYLLKPIHPDELVDAVARVREARKERHPAQERIRLPASEGVILASPDEILYFTGDGRYTTAVLMGGRKLLMARNIGLIDAELPSGHFFRIHKSCIVNLGQIVRVIRNDGGLLEMRDGTRHAISRRRKAELLQLLGV